MQGGKGETPMKNGIKSSEYQTQYDKNEARWEALKNRQTPIQSDFFYGVITTGVYCGPNSPTKLPRRENIIFFDTAEEAEIAGFRRSKREKQSTEAVNIKNAAAVAEACRLLDATEEPLNLTMLAEKVGMSAFHFHRTFKKLTGLTPKAYSVSATRSRVRDQLSQKITVTDALYEAGFNSNSRFYEASNQILGMKPKEYKAGGEKLNIVFALGECALGSILVAKSERGICAISLGDDPDTLIQNFQDQYPKANLIGGNAEFEKIVAHVVGFVESPGLEFGLPLDIRGTVFQERVWQALREIPAGTTSTYAEIARSIGMPKSVRAVANACGANKLAVAIPCHRVVRSDRSLSGYRWGVERKRKLLDRESEIQD